MIADLLLALLESLPGATPVLEENKGIAFGLIGDAVDDCLAMLNLAVLAEDRGEGFDGAVPSEAMDEDLAVGGIRIGKFRALQIAIILAVFYVKIITGH